MTQRIGLAQTPVDTWLIAVVVAWKFLFMPTRRSHPVLMPDRAWLRRERVDGLLRLLHPELVAVSANTLPVGVMNRGNVRAVAWWPMVSTRLVSGGSCYRADGADLRLHKRDPIILVSIIFVPGVQQVRNDLCRQ